MIIRSAGTAALAALLLTGCAPAGPADVTPPPSVDASATTEDRPPAEVAKERASGYVAAFVSAADTVRGEPSAHRDGTSLDAVAEGTAKADLQIDANRLSKAGYHQEGQTTVGSMKTTSVTLENDPGTHPPVYPTVELTACVDRSAVRFVDDKGKTVSNGTTKPMQRGGRATFSVRNRAWPDTNGWRVVWVKQSSTPC